MKLDKDLLRGIAGVLMAFAIIGGIHLVRPGVSSAPDFPCSTSSKGTVSIDVSAGESGSSIAQELYEKGVTASYGSFFGVAVADERSARIAPGSHLIDKRICAKDALVQLLDSQRITNLINVIEGAWNSEIKRELESIGYSKSEISEGFASLKPPSGFSKLEGLLFPAQYSFDSSTTVSEIITKMIMRGQRERDASGISSGSGSFTPAQLLIIASLVQAEGGIEDFRKISQVIRNRLVKGMPLQFDSTVHYVQQQRGSIFLSMRSTLLNSPYNTYRRYGLPPGPINNPGRAAMDAATNPEKGPWLFFITVAPGDTRFTESFDEFNSWKVLYKKNLRAGKFGDQ